MEPYRIPPTSESECMSFMKHLTGAESFDFPGSERPRSWIMDSVAYRYPDECNATGWLLSCSVDDFLAQVSATDLQTVLKRHYVGELDVRYGGNHGSTSLRARPGRWKG